MGSPPPAGSTADRDWGELLLGIVVAGFGVAVVWQTAQIRITPAYSMVGPRAVPLIVGVGLILVGLWVAAEAVTGRATAPTTESDDADPTLPTDWRAVGLLAVALILYLLLMQPVGFIPASTILFAGAAFAMGSRRTGRDLLLGLAFALILYLAFTAGLGLRLPLGFLEGLR